MKHRISPRGILEKDGKILFIEYKDSQGIFYSLPGGSQNTGEDLRTSLHREFKEETDLDIESHEIILVREFMLTTSDFELWKDGIHQIEIIFKCSLVNADQVPGAGSHLDIGMTGFKWLTKEEIKSLRVYPTKDLIEIIENNKLTYLLN